MDVLKQHLTLPRLALTAVLATAIGCSLTYDWDPDGQPCRQEGNTFACDSGFSCYQQPNVAGTECVRDGSRRRGEACSLDSMCDDGLQCVGGACREGCGASYFSPTLCRGDEFCKPYPGEANGFCTPSECLSDGCTVGRICTRLKDGAGACLVECTPRFNDQSYSDNCGSTTGANFCQALGRERNRRLVCLDTNAAGQSIGTFCNAIDAPCAANQSYRDANNQLRTFGLTCVSSQCVELCDQTAPNPGTNDLDCGASTGRGATYCCAQEGAPDGNGVSARWGICIPAAIGCDPQIY